jgi:bifunctional DNA-binding transcriptional regulator/antitoxin component of YhaV-PrlF toxin-antitoxin module
MPAKVKRTMMKHGTSGVVTIPMSYRKYHDLNPGDEMIVMYDSLILMAPKGMEYVIEKRKALIDELLGVLKEPTKEV